MVSGAERMLAERALRHRLVTTEKLNECIAIQQKMAREGKQVALLRILLKLGYLNERQVAFLKSGDGVGLNLEKERHRRAIEGYELVRRIGRGGTATVYLARRDADGLEAAVKILFPHHRVNRRIVDRFLNEGNLLQRLRHENIVAGYDAGTSNHFHYVALEYVPGYPVKSILDKKGVLSEDLALHVILQTAKSLRYLATQGVTHRDIKPGNILITRDGTIKLCDLGFAKLAEEGIEAGYTWGTANYISPEQVSGTPDLDVRSDIYSLGATLYHMVVGEVPFKGSSHAEVMTKQVEQALSTKKVKGGNISHHMHYFLEKMMAKERDIRYETPDELIEDIERTVQGSRELVFAPTGGGQNSPLREVVEFFTEHGDPDDSGTPSERRAQAAPAEEPPREERRESRALKKPLRDARDTRRTSRRSLDTKRREGSRRLRPRPEE